MANTFRSVLASGGGVVPTGDAQPADVLDGKTFSNADGIDKTGTMVNRGAVSETIAGGQTYTIPAGYHNGSGTVTAQQSGGTFNPSFDGTGSVTDGNYYVVMGWDITKNNLANGTWSGATVEATQPVSEEGTSTYGYRKLWVLKATGNTLPTFSISGPSFRWCGEFSNIV